MATQTEQPAKVTQAGILFLDVKGYGKLEFDERHVFHKYVMKNLYDIAVSENGKNNYLCMNTWGDGIILVREDYLELIRVALELKNYFKMNKYKNIKIKELHPLYQCNLSSRIAVHYGEFRTTHDYFQARDTCYGNAIILPARIEPITPPGRVWATETIRDWVENVQSERGTKLYKFHEQGKHTLPKNFGNKMLYEVTYLNIPPDPIPQSEKIDKTIAHKIEVLTGIDPNEKGLNKCHHDQGKFCEVQPNSICLISELARVSESSEESLKVIKGLKYIYNAISTLIAKDKERCLEDVHLQQLYKKIDRFLEIFPGLVRKNVEYEEKWKSRMKKAFLGFIWHRTKEAHNSTKVKELEHNLNNFRFSYKKGEIEIAEDKRLDRSKVHLKSLLQELEDSKSLLRVLILHLEGDLAKRLRGNHLAAKKGFANNFNLKDLGKCIEKSISSLPHNKPDGDKDFLSDVWPSPIPERT